MSEIPAETQVWAPNIVQYFNQLDAYHFTALRRLRLRARMMGTVESATARRGGVSKETETEVEERRNRHWMAEGWTRVEEPRFDYFSFERDPGKRKA